MSKKLFISFPSKDLAYPDLKEYLNNILVGEISIKRGKNKGKRKPTNVRLIVTDDSDFKTMTEFKHLVKGVELKVQPFLNNQERAALVKEKLCRRIYINNLPLDVQHEDLFTIFKVFDKIEEIFIKQKVEPFTGKKYIAAFVTFSSELGFSKCAAVGQLRFKGTDRLLDLLKFDAVSANSSDSENVLQVSSGLKSGDTPVLRNEEISRRPAIPNRLARSHGPSNQEGPSNTHVESELDWMGLPKENKRRISSVLRSPQRYEYSRTRFGRRVRFSNIRFNREAIKQDQNEPQYARNLRRERTDLSGFQSSHHQHHF